MSKATEYKVNLSLQRHVEGGWYAEVYRSGLVLPQTALTHAHRGNRNAMTSIYFLLEAGDFSAFHRIASDEVWHHLDGDELAIHEITPQGVHHIHRLGKDIDGGAAPFAAISAGSWFASEVTAGGYALCACTVAPGFDFQDFELAARATLVAGFPQHQSLIDRLTRQ
ncbi:MAG: cupin domain-containing protein [Chitinophagia bacterium]|nr:cupin domain-containing protein [Chitinophagia bacterium]